MINSNRIGSIVAEMLDLKDACPDCGTQMTEETIGRTINLWYCNNCEVFRLRKNKYGSKRDKEDVKI